MFTGLIDDVGTVERVTATAAGRDVRVRCAYEDLAEGESVALNGACLTVRERGARWFTVAAVETTLGRTTIGEWAAGTRVNLERALRLSDRLGGHLVQGHVDGRGTIVSVTEDGFARRLRVALPDELHRYVADRGSVAIDGVSLTVAALTAQGLEVSLIPETLERTTLGRAAPGRVVNLEVDVLAKYVEKLVAR